MHVDVQAGEASELSRESDLAARLQVVRERVRDAAARCVRDADEVTLIGVSKTHPAALVGEALRAGLFDLGENRVQEAAEKRAEFAGEQSNARWHLIGHLQANKARRAVETFDVIHTLDSIALAERLNRICVEVGRENLAVLVQVDLGGETTKAGIAENELSRVVDAVRRCERLRLTGLMTLPPFFDDAEDVRPFFRRLRELRDGLAAAGEFADSAGELSMGMSHDFEIAIEEGATMVRVGTAIFGRRPAQHAKSNQHL